MLLLVQGVFDMLLRSLDAAQRTILHHEAGLTTLCIAFICPLESSCCHAACVLSVGDSLAYVMSRRHGLREITTGSRDVSCERDIRDAGGALGPARNGCDPELHNLTLSMTLVDPTDIVFLTSDGISDNFDPVITKIACPLITQTDEDAETAAADSADDSETGQKHRKTDFYPHSAMLVQCQLSFSVCLFVIIKILSSVGQTSFLQCFDAVGWATGRASGL